MFFRSLFALCLALAVTPLRAEEHGGTSSESEANYSGKQDQTWELIQTKLGALKTKMDSQTALVNTMIAEKAALAKSEDVAKKADELKIQYHKLETLVADYNSLNEEYLTKFPERGLKEKRIYQRVKVKTLDSFEDDFTLRGRLNKLHGKVLRQYPGAVQAESRKGSHPPKTPVSEISPAHSEDVTGTIELKK